MLTKQEYKQLEAAIHGMKKDAYRGNYIYVCDIINLLRTYIEEK